MIQGLGHLRRRMMQGLEHLPSPPRAVVIIARIVGYGLLCTTIFLGSAALGAGIAEVWNRL